MNEAAEGSDPPVPRADRGGFDGLRERATRLARREHQTAEELHIHQIELELQNEELQRALAENEALLDRQRALFDDAPIATLDVEGGRIVQCNHAATALVSDRTGQPLLALAVEGNRGSLLHMLQ
ncbi:MAG: hypothetical protein AAGA56_30535, partial [Myxococcota bacterium]